MKDTATLLYEWRQLRLQLKEQFCESNLQKIIDWWGNLEQHTNGFDFDRTDTWSDVWEYINYGFFTKSGNGLACFLTVYHADNKKDPELWLIHDLLHSHLYLVTYVDGYILNRSSKKLEKYEDIKDDIDILNKKTKEEILQAIKFKD